MKIEYHQHVKGTSMKFWGGRCTRRKKRQSSISPVDKSSRFITVENSELVIFLENHINEGSLSGCDISDQRAW